MSLVAMSRFSSLQIVEDDYVPPKPKEPKGKKIEPTNIAKKSDEKKTKNGSRNKANKTNINVAQANIKKKGPKEITNPEHWEDAKCDNEPLDEKFEEDLKQAMLLSRNYEKNCNDDDSPKGNKEPFKMQNGKKQKKNKSVPPPHEEQLEIIGFVNNDHMDRLAGNDDLSHRKNGKILEINGANVKREQPSNEEIKGSQMKSVLDDKEKEITTLKAMVNKLKEELIKVKSRNKLLCGVIATGEMKEKAEVLIEVAELREVQRELTNEVSLLHAQLEQERSKTSTAKVDTKFKLKYKNTKTVRFDVSTEKKRTLSDKEA